MRVAAADERVSAACLQRMNAWALKLRTACASRSESPLRAPFGRIDGMVATPSAIAAPQRVVASNFFKVVLRKRRYSRCKCTDPRRLKALARGTQELLATAPHI